jgi:mRNA interferase MazF
MSALVLARRQVVLLPFPFSDLSAHKLRPALMMADAGRGDWVMCQITSQSYSDTHSVALADSDFAQGGLRLASYARPTKLFTASSSLVRSVAGQLNRAAHERVCEALIALIRPGDADLAAL